LKTNKTIFSSSIPPQFSGKWRQVADYKIEEDLLLLEVNSKSAILTMKSLPGSSKTYTFQKLVQSSDKDLKIKCVIPDITLEFEIKDNLLYLHENFPPPALPHTIYEVYERY
jgi:hypothetical protein